MSGIRSGLPVDPLQAALFDAASLIDELEAQSSEHLAELQADPVAWVNEQLDEFLWSKQREMLVSVRDNRRTAVRTCHEAGKSYLAARAAAWWIDSHKLGEAFVLTSAPTFRQVRAILWRELGRAHAHGELVGRMSQTEWWVRMPAGNEEIVAFGQKPSDMAPDAFQGIHQRFVLVIFDEASGIVEALWDAADGSVANVGSRFLAIGNPTDPTSEFATVCKPGSGWNVIGVSAFDTPNFTGEPVPQRLSELLISPTWQREKLAKWGKDSPLYISRVLGEFPKVTTDGLIPMDWVRRAQQRNLEADGPAQLGVDVGHGGDRNIIVKRRGPVARVYSRDQEPNTMQTLGNVIAALEKTGADVARVDQIGIGAGAVDRAEEIAADQAADPRRRELAGRVRGVNVGAGAVDVGAIGDEVERRSGKERFVNLRAQGYWGLRELFQEGEIDIPEDGPGADELAAQLVDLRFKRTSSGKIQVESKEDMRKRGKSSPDEADALMLAFLEIADEEEIVATW